MNNDISTGSKVFVTGTAGFIGFHLAKLLLESGCIVHGYDAYTEYYDIRLKQERSKILKNYNNYSETHGLLEDLNLFRKAVSDFDPEIIVHLAAQAGVRYSIENPRAYVDSNLIGSFNVLEMAKERAIKHLLIASTSSVYGANETMPFTESQKADTQITFYAATKKAVESMAHSYAYINGIAVTVFRFFTVYGPWGRPDMALFKFTKGILNSEPIDVFNHGDMYRDFTYVDDLVESIRRLVSAIPDVTKKVSTKDNLSPVAPFRIVNIGNSSKIRLLDFIEAIESELGMKAIKNNLPMQKGDVPATWADATLLEELTNFKPSTDYKEGVQNFVRWYKAYYGV